MANTCAVSCLIVSKPSLSLDVNIFTSESFSISWLKSFNFPFTLIIRASLNNVELISFAISKPFIDLSNLIFFPFGKVILGIY